MLQRRIFKITIILFSILVALSCNNHQNEKKVESGSVGKKQINEKQISKKPNITKQKEFKTCESLITEILTTSPRYKEITKGLSKAVIKNGGLAFGFSLEGSPNPKQDKAHGYSKTYDFTIYEMYTDRQLNAASFSFNPIKKQLYEYDAVNDRLNSVEFDRSLLLKYEALCN
jgi:hypothetical protein